MKLTTNEWHRRREEHGRRLAAAVPLPIGLTEAQKSAARRVLAYVGRQHGERTEFKRCEFDVTDRGVLSLFVIAGMSNDAGTLAAVYVRTLRHVFIGPRGGIRCYDSRPGVSRCYRGFSDCVILDKGGDS